MRMLAQTTLLGGITSIAFGDFSGLLAAAPALLGNLAYSRDFEREADGDAIALLQANGIPPAVMATMFERLQAHQRKAGMPDLPIALGSHPPDQERMARFRDASATR
jgi:predicted Zn-dependent protease